MASKKENDRIYKFIEDEGVNLDIEGALSRIKKILGKNSNKEIAPFLNASPQQISFWKTRDQFPLVFMYLFAIRYNVDFRWLCEGKVTAPPEINTKLFAAILEGIENYLTTTNKKWTTEQKVKIADLFYRKELKEGSVKNNLGELLELVSVGEDLAAG